MKYKTSSSILGEEIKKIVEDAVKETHVELTADDVKLIANEIMPDLDLIIAKKVKQHLAEIGQFMVNTFYIGE